ncbi:MAG: N-acetylglucosamine-6-phosphate deacetylase [Brevefilum sp.]|jgi:N-acetylglucosamine-6-phosphate deacetylase
METRIVNACLVLPDRLLENGAVTINEGGKLDFVGEMKNLPAGDAYTIDLKGKYLAPGFIDIHVHGGNGVTFGDGDLAAETAKYSEWVASTGVTGYLMSIAGRTPDLLDKMIEGYTEVFADSCGGAETLGLHLEGPFLNVEKKGAFNPEWLRIPKLDEMEAYIQAGKGWIRQMTLAPELPGADQVAKLCKKAGILVALGHTNASFEQAAKVLKGDYGHVTHTFNAQSGFSHRAPGVFGAILLSEGMTAELIADTVHVHPGAMRLLVKCLGSDRIVAVTDAITGAGFADGVYHVAGFDVYVRDGRATLANGTLAGSITTMDRCVANLVEHVGLSLHEAVQTASLNPARAIGVADRLGSVETGKDASLTVFDDQIDVQLTMVNGQIVYNILD